MEIEDWEWENHECDEDKKNSQGTFLSLIVQDGWLYL